MDGSGAHISSYRDLLVWQRAMDLTVRCYEETKSFPKEEIYGLTSQMRRCCASVAANIADGYGRESSGAYVHHLKIAQGSLKEFETHIILRGECNIWSAPLKQECFLKRKKSVKC